jgi:hypothetical protein
MEILSIQKDYGWILKVLDSCVTEQQVKTCENLLDNFINKWSDEISDIRRQTFVSNYRRHCSQKVLNLRKSG